MDQHKVIHSSLEKIFAVISLGQEDPTKFDPEELKKLMVELREPLVSVRYPSSCNDRTWGVKKSWLTGSCISRIVGTPRRRSHPPRTWQPESLHRRRDPCHVPRYGPMGEEKRKCVLDASFHARVSPSYPSYVQLQVLVAALSTSSRVRSSLLTIRVFVRHTAPEFKPYWPQFPWFLRKLLIPWVLAWRYSG